ncbi:hypothetical protein CDD82_4367 [Ophiocordyceps australis]|uniref:Peptide hydrolase n=1 Tax=Ophiocordyceps australis TaxID=1399860 RepID=A0A2C5YC20_9HYPO|nr:hypothetical protein CDD82_4367 [Ophiocordyceps australis]
MRIELEPGVTMMVNENDKWNLRKHGKNFMDVTKFPGSRYSQEDEQEPDAVLFPEKCFFQDHVQALLPKLETKPMKRWLNKFSSFHTRFYKSDSGRKSSIWLQKEAADIAKGKDRIGVDNFPHDWSQPSVLAVIPGKTDNTIVVGAHQDSINQMLPTMRSPGADDDGSGTVTLLEVFRVLVKHSDLGDKMPLNTIEFHWYSAEEAGLLGSQEIFYLYSQTGRKVKAMLQQDMTGYVQRTLDAGLPESLGVVTDYVDPGMTAFIKTVINEYCDIPWVETQCGYACSDHASATKAGYPASFVIESQFNMTNPFIHSAEDTVEHVSYDHMLQHAKMTLGLVYELAYFDFDRQNQFKGKSGGKPKKPKKPKNPLGEGA